MKVFILTKKRIVFILASFLLSAFLTFFSMNVMFTHAKKSKKLPIYRVDTKEKKVSISFDAAWGNEQTADLLKILKEFNVKTTFFLVGQWVDKYPESVKCIFDDGHDIANHSNTHPHMSNLNNEEIEREIKECNMKIKNITGEFPKYFRAPYGHYNNAVIEILSKLGMLCIQWNVDSLDWKNRTPEQMIKIINKKIEPGSIILFHNGGKHTVESLSKIIILIRGKGYKIVKLSDLLYKEGYKVSHDGAQVLENTEENQ
ncbi:MAG: polysaccharide deacetylase family protein [Candidatus Improbicoccus pseudotrichonymphae]|uniref:Polysaccharide deacetylase family protein n=1 Tax=Candidatus Improbicoccus pseudotrichonymphae TaxID=3033792 RepID=A0AA48IAB8_9FIRM|nr:MAG: polysaccharide deacetylase family protein [Candidatus Improbicoccus pseudotrichonymphae]